MADAGTKAAEKREKLREKLWTGTGPDVFNPGNKQTKGYARTPRVVPLVARLINEIGGTENAGSLYQVLWAQDWGQGIVEVRSFKGLLYEAGYAGKGPRIERTWEERIGILEDLGLVRTASRGLDRYGYVLLLNPYTVIPRMRTDALGDKEKAKFGTWLQQYELFCEQWGIEDEVPSPAASPPEVDVTSAAAVAGPEARAVSRPEIQLTPPVLDRAQAADPGEEK